MTENILQEKIYTTNINQSIDEIEKNIDDFFGEIIDRRKDTNIHESLQAAAVIYPNYYAGKITEEDGLESHFTSQINLIRYLNNKREYITEKDSTNFELFETDYNKMLESIRLSIMCNKDELRIMGNSNYGIESRFQQFVIETLAQNCQKYFDEQIINKIIFGIDDLEINKWNDHSLEEIKNFLNQHLMVK